MELHFLCDAMLASLGRWLRVAGYDTKIVMDSLDDNAIFATAVKENRKLLTRDRHFIEMKEAKKHIVFLHGNSLEENIDELNQHLKMNWLHHPFSRCIICNELLQESEDPSLLKQVPIMVQERAKEFWYCAHCKKVYWPGSHTEKMLHQLQHWQRKNKPPLDLFKK